MEWFHSWWQGLGLVGQIMACAAIPMTVVMFLQLILMIIGAGFGGESDSDADGDGPDFDADSDSDFDAQFDADHDAGFDVHDAFDSQLDADHDMDFDTHDGPDAGFDADDHEFSGGAAVHDAGHHQISLKLLTVRGVVAFFALGGWAGLAALTAGIRPLWSIMIALLAGVAAMLVASVVIRFALKMQSSGNLILKNAVAQIADVYITIPPSRSNTGKVTMVLQERFVELDAMTDSLEALKPHTKVEVIDTIGRDCLLVRAAQVPEE